ncbi:serine hydrolase domain-containing protein, partial [Anaerosolibacter sp.]|uniref:serine hydrolase domain-containing protein n=1 Tax=Anaerosolibacter sp. TaxID=1872527 RepID=UPI0039EFB68E
MDRDKRMKIDKFFKELEKDKEFSGGILIAQGEKIIIKESYGIANHALNIKNQIKSKYLIASITKSITAMAIMILNQQNKLDINDPLDKYIPDFLNGDRITIHHLLTHTAGIWQDPEFIENVKIPHTMTELIGRFKHKKLEFEPGSKFEYSNLGYTMLAYIIEKVTGLSYEQFIQENIFDKLSMYDTGCYRNDNTVNQMTNGYIKVNEEIINCDVWELCNFKGSGDLYSTIDNLYVWTKALITGKLLEKQNNDKLLVDYGHIYDNFYYGYGKILYKKDGNIEYFYQDGGLPGFKSIYVVYPQRDLVIILL